MAETDILGKFMAALQASGGSVRQAQFPSEGRFFNRRQDVPAFHQGNEVVFNPFNPRGQATVPNEIIRILLDTQLGNAFTGLGGSTEDQRSRLAAMQQPAESSSRDVSATAIARLLTNDQSLAPYSGSQIFAAGQLANSPRALLEQQLLQRGRR